MLEVSPGQVGAANVAGIMAYTQPLPSSHSIIMAYTWLLPIIVISFDIRATTVNQPLSEPRTDINLIMQGLLSPPISTQKQWPSITACSMFPSSLGGRVLLAHSCHFISPSKDRATYLACSARAHTPAARGALADVPVWRSVQLFRKSVVTYGKPAAVLLHNHGIPVLTISSTQVATNRWNEVFTGTKASCFLLWLIKGESYWSLMEYWFFCKSHHVQFRVRLQIHCYTWSPVLTSRPHCTTVFSSFLWRCWWRVCRYCWCSHHSCSCLCLGRRCLKPRRIWTLCRPAPGNKFHKGAEHCQTVSQYYFVLLGCFLLLARGGSFQWYYLQWDLYKTCMLWQCTIQFSVLANYNGHCYPNKLLWPLCRSIPPWPFETPKVWC